MRGIVLEAAVLRRVVGWRDDDAVRESRRAAAVPGEDRVRDDGRRREPVAIVDHDFDFVCRQNFQRGGEGRLG